MLGMQSAIPRGAPGCRIDVPCRTARRIRCRLVGGGDFFNPLDLVFGLLGKALGEDRFFELGTFRIGLFPPGQFSIRSSSVDSPASGTVAIAISIRVAVALLIALSPRAGTAFLAEFREFLLFLSQMLAQLLQQFAALR